MSESVEDSLVLPSEQIPPTWVVKGAIDLGVDLQGQEDEGTFTFLSTPTTIMAKVVHYYAHCSISDSQANADLTQDTTEVGNEEVESLLSQVSETPASQQKTGLSRFLKLFVHIVNKKQGKGVDNGICLSGDSKLLTFDEYMDLVLEQEVRKKEVDEIKERKKKQIKENKATCILAKQKKDSERNENEIPHKEKERLKELEKENEER